MTCEHEYVFGLHELATIPTCLKCSGRKTDNELTAANARIAALEALLGEAPHSPGCASRSCGVGLNNEHFPGKCDCFKGRVGE